MTTPTPHDDLVRLCRKDDPAWLWPCSCDDCARSAAAAWHATADRVLAGELTIYEANAQWDTPTTEEN